MTLNRSQIALNALQWINLKQPENGPKDKPVWLYNEPSWRSEQPKVHQQVKDAGAELVVSSDMLVADRHFFADADPDQLGHKALAVNLSDLAAMGARPVACTRTRTSEV